MNKLAPSRLLNAFKSVCRNVGRSRTPSRSRRPCALPACLESLEDRTLLAAQVVALGDFAIAGDFSVVGTNYSADSSTDILQVGFGSDLSDFQALLSIDGSLNFDSDAAANTNSSFFVTGGVSSFSGTGNAIDLFNSLSNMQFVGTDLVDQSSGGYAVPVMGEMFRIGDAVDFTPDHLFLADATMTGGNPEVWLGGSFTLDALKDINGASVSGSVSGDTNFVIVDGAGVDGFAAVLDDKFDVGKIEFDVDELAVSYTASTNLLTHHRRDEIHAGRQYG